MTSDDLPDPDDLSEVLAFTMRFGGYEKYGSFIALADAAKARRRETIDDLIAEMFFEYRALNHLGVEKSALADLYRDELLPHFRRLLA